MVVSNDCWRLILKYIPSDVSKAVCITMICPTVLEKVHVDIVKEYAYAASESLHYLQFIHSIYGTFPENIYVLVAKKGDINVFEWLYSLGVMPTTEITSTVARWGHMHILRWLQAHKVYPFTEFVLQWAVVHDNYDMALMALENGTTWDAEVCNIAAYKGNLAFLKFAIEAGAPWNKTAILSRAKKHPDSYKAIAGYINGLRY